jgi:hypothetical protein
MMYVQSIWIDCVDDGWIGLLDRVCGPRWPRIYVWVAGHQQLPVFVHQNLRWNSSLAKIRNAMAMFCACVAFV